MIEYFCDKYGERKEGTDLYIFAFLRHLEPDQDLSTLHVDNEGNRVSRVQARKHLCIACYNRVVSKAVQEFYKEDE